MNSNNSLTKSFLKSAAWGFATSFLYSFARDQWRYRSFKGAVVVISGGSRGLGLVMAKEFARQGAVICLLARDEDELRRAQNLVQFEIPTCEVLIQACDCTVEIQVRDAINTIVDAFGRVDVLVNNAGIISSAPIENADKKDFSDSLDIHFWAPFYLVNACLPHMREGSRIVNISSIGGLVAIPHRAAYGAGKFALAGYSEALRSELSPRGIYVTTVFPGLMRTGSVDHALFKGQTAKEYNWFSLAAAMPLITTSAESAARRIVTASKVGQAELKLSLSTKLAALAHGVAPEMLADIFALANLVMPGPSKEVQQENVEGRDTHTWLSPSVLTTLTQKAERKNNELNE
jgi:Short-chain dehydrogenases of various substrate specificities